MREGLNIVCVVAALGMLGIGAGCVSSSSDAQRKAAEQKRTYLLEAGMPTAKLAGGWRDGVKVRAFRGLPPFNTASIVVKRANGETALDFYNAWVAPPHELVRVQAMRYLEAAGLFPAVYDGASGTAAPLGLEGTVCELFLDCRGARPEAVVTLRLAVLDERAPQFTVLRSAEKTARAAYDAERGGGLPCAFNAALTQALGELAEALGVNR